MRNILARIASIVIIIAALAPCAPFAANAAYDYYWFGTAGDGNWMNVENWSTTSNEYTKATYWPHSTSFDVFIDTSRASDHHLTIRVPRMAPSGNTPGCASFTFYDSTGEGTLTMVGEGNEEGMAGFPLGSNRKPTWTETGHPMHLELFNFVLRNGTLSVVENECPGCSVLVSNCLATSSDNSYFMKLPGQHGGTMTIVDSEITTQRLNGTSDSDVAGYVFAVTNSTIRIGADCYVGGPGTVVDFFNSTIAFGMYAPVFGAKGVGSTNEHPNISVRFKNSVFESTNKSGIFAYFLSDNGKLVFDNVTQAGVFNGIDLIGFTTWLTNTSFKFCSPNENGYRGIGGDLYLDNSEWLNTNASKYTILNAPLHVTLSGKAPRFGTSRISASAGQPLTLDFLVPKGGYAYPPVNRMDNTITGTVFPSSVVGGSINVLPESPAARKSETIICPLVYVKDPSAKVCALANLPLTTLPNEKSKFLVTTDYSWEYADVMGKAESDWTEVAVGYNSNVAGVAVKIVGPKPGLSIFIR